MCSQLQGQRENCSEKNKKKKEKNLYFQSKNEISYYHHRLSLNKLHQLKQCHTDNSSTNKGYNSLK